MVKRQDYEKAARLRDKERKVLEKLEQVKEDFEKKQDTDRKEVTEEMVYDVVANMTKIPVSKLNQNEMEGLLNLEESLNQR